MDAERIEYDDEFEMTPEAGEELSHNYEPEPGTVEAEETEANGANEETEANEESEEEGEENG